MDADTLTERVPNGDRRALGRLITLLESDDPTGIEVLRRLHGHGEDCHVIGITGSPGTGKSTLTDRLITYYRKAGKTVGVIAVDPSSPFSGGAILGDRIRMQGRSKDKEVFIRSMGTRGALGGLSSHTADAVRAMAVAGKDIVIVETVGVGQAEVDVIRLADTVLVVLVPNLGDDVQAVKAGVMEIADIFVINKSDLTGADKVHSEVEGAMALAPHPEEGEVVWWPPVARTIAERGDGVAELASHVESHVKWSKENGHWHVRREQRLRNQVRDLVTKHAVGKVFTPRGEVRPKWQALFEDARAGKLSPHDIAATINSN